MGVDRWVYRYIKETHNTSDDREEGQPAIKSFTTGIAETVIAPLNGDDNISAFVLL
jgi:hypothetical protein